MPIFHKCINSKCNNVFNKTKNPTSIYCNKDCKKKHNIDLYNTDPKKCKQCGNIFSYEQKNKFFCDNSCSAIYNNTGRKHTLETKSKIRKIRINNPIGCIGDDISYEKSLSTRRKNSNKHIYSFNCKTCNKKVESKTNKFYCSNKCWLTSGNCGGLRPNSTKKTRKYYNGFQMDSGSELAFAKLMDENNIKWYKNSTTYFNFIDSNNKIRKYYPDFYLSEYDLWVEIKGEYYIRIDDEKRRASVKNIVLIMSDNITSILAILSGIEPESKQ